MCDGNDVCRVASPHPPTCPPPVQVWVSLLRVTQLEPQKGLMRDILDALVPTLVDKLGTRGDDGKVIWVRCEGTAAPCEVQQEAVCGAAQGTRPLGQAEPTRCTAATQLSGGKLSVVAVGSFHC